MKAILSITIFAIHVSALTPLHASAEDAQPGKGQYVLNYEGAKVTVRANDADTVQLLQDFAQKSGIAFNKYVGKTKTVTLDLNGVTVEEFLNRVLGSYVATSKKKNGAAQISKVTIMDEEEAPPPGRVGEGAREKPPKPGRPERASSRRRRRPSKPPSRRVPDEPQPSDQSSEALPNEPQPPGPPEQPEEEANPVPPQPDPEQQPEQQPEP